MEGSGRGDNGDADDRMVLVHMASFGNNSGVKDYSLYLKVAEFYRSGSHREVYSMSLLGYLNFISYLIANPTIPTPVTCQLSKPFYFITFPPSMLVSFISSNTL